jgi:hypothetical protein
MLRTERIAIDGRSVRWYREGEIINLPEALATALIRDGIATDKLTPEPEGVAVGSPAEGDPQADQEARIPQLISSCGKYFGWPGFPASGFDCVSLDDLRTIRRTPIARRSEGALRVDFSDEDAMIAGYISAARELVEEETDRALVTQTWSWGSADSPIAIASGFPGQLQSIELQIYR